MRHRYLRPSLSLPEMLQSDLDIEYAIDGRLNTVIMLCESDFVTRDMSWGCRTVCSPKLEVVNQQSESAALRKGDRWLHREIHSVHRIAGR